MGAFVRPRLTVGTVVLMAMLAAPLQAATPRDELLRFVPPDIGFCVVLQGLRDTGAALSSSPFMEQFHQSAAGKALQDSKEVHKLLGVEEELKKNLGIGWDDLRNDILGDAVVFAYRPGKSGEDQGLMLIRARNARALGDLVEHFNKKQMADDGPLKELKELRYKDIPYFRRLEKRLVRGEMVEETTFYHLRGPVLVFSGQEEMLHRALDLDRDAAPDAEPALTTLLRELGADRALLAVYLNPRALDAEYAAKAAGPGGAFLKTFLVYWKAIDGMALSLTLDRDVTLAIGVRGRSEALPAPAQKLFGELVKPSDLWRQCPDNALVAICARIDFAALVGVLGDFLDPDNRQKLSKDLNRILETEDAAKRVLPLIGPDLGLWLTAPTDPAHLVPEVLFALRTRVGEKGDRVDEALLDRIKFGLAVLGSHDRFRDKPLVRDSVTIDKQEVKFFRSEALPAGLRPAFALKDGFLLLAGTPELVGRFVAPPSSGDGPAPLLRVSFKAWRSYIEARRVALTKMLVEKEKLTQDEAAERINDVLAALAFVDRLDVRLQAGKGHAVVSIVVQTAKPLKK
jgi:hypothetical protein